MIMLFAAFYDAKSLQQYCTCFSFTMKVILRLGPVVAESQITCSFPILIFINTGFCVVVGKITQPWLFLTTVKDVFNFCLLYVIL